MENITKYISIYGVRHNRFILMRLLMLCKTCRVRAALYTIKPTIPIISQADPHACVVQQGRNGIVVESVEGSLAILPNFATSKLLDRSASCAPPPASHTVSVPRNTHARRARGHKVCNFVSHHLRSADCKSQAKTGYRDGSRIREGHDAGRE